MNVKTGKFLRASEAGVGTANQFVTLVKGTPMAVDPSDAKTAVDGDLDEAATLGGTDVVTSFRMLKDASAAKSFNEYAQVAGLEPSRIEALAREFTSHGKKAAIDFYRGPIKTTYGYYTAQAIILLFTWRQFSILRRPRSLARQTRDLAAARDMPRRLATSPRRIPA